MVQPQLIQLNLDMAAKLALLFQEARSARSISKQIAAKGLLLSTAQLEGLESGVSKSFYSPRIYAQAAKKYCAYLDLNFDIDQLLVYPQVAEQTSGEAVTSVEMGGEEGKARQGVFNQPLRAALARSPLAWGGIAACAMLVSLYTQQDSLGETAGGVREVSAGLVSPGPDIQVSAPVEIATQIPVKPAAVEGVVEKQPASQSGLKEGVERLGMAEAPTSVPRQGGVKSLPKKKWLLLSQVPKT